MDNSLDIPDHPSWRTDPRYSWSAARWLAHAYAAIIARKTDPRSFDKARTFAARCLEVAKSPPQRLRACYVLAMAHSAWGEHATAVHWVDEALELGVKLDDHSALRDLLYLRGVVNTERLRYRAAAEDYDDCLTLLRAQPDRKVSAAVVAFEVNVAVQHAGGLLMLAEPEAVASVLADARSLLMEWPAREVEATSIEYVQAYAHRIGGLPDMALLPALRVAAVYTERASLESASRAHLFATDVVLDMAERAPDGTDRGGFLEMAQPHMQLAVSLAKEAGDVGAMAMWQLRQARFDRVACANEASADTIEEVVRGAWRRGDTPLLTDAYTLLGDELASRGERESALTCYRCALEVVDTSEHPGMGIWARRKLHRDGEDHP